MTAVLQTPMSTLDIWSDEILADPHDAFTELREQAGAVYLEASDAWAITRYDGIVEVFDVGETVAARWTFTRGLPMKIAGPQLNARTGEVAIEELTIAHEGLTLAPL